jgi:pyridoxamine 5'-phosphate oxidase
VTDPYAVFQQWFDEARAAGEPMAEAMALATATPDGHPSVRFVLYRGHSAQGFRFFTNYQSRKGEELAANPFAALAWHWERITRQVRVEGRVSRLSAADSDAYFHARPRGSQLAALASPQSRPFTYQELEARYTELDRQYQGQEVIPRPPHWGGFLLVPERIEFWEGREFRLHRRVLYTPSAAGWTSRELAP